LKKRSKFAERVPNNLQVNSEGRWLLQRQQSCLALSQNWYRQHWGSGTVPRA